MLELPGKIIKLLQTITDTLSNSMLLPLLAVAPCLAQPCAAAPGEWDFAGNLNTGRYLHTATLLSDGKVLVVGGFLESGDTDSAELYDPATGTWSSTGRLNTSRTEHTATLLPNAMVLVAGGSHDFTATASAELYDPATGTWSVTGSLNTARSAHSAVLLSNGKVLVAGGLDLRSAEIYDPATGNWTTTGSFVRKHDPVTGPVPLTLLLNGNVLLEGGLGLQLESSSDAELYDPASGTWRLTDSLATAREGHSATLLRDGRVLVATGLNRDLGDLTSAELYDPATGLWSTTGSLLQDRERHTATLLSNGLVLVAGGNADGTFTTEAELYDSATGTWTVTGSLNAGRADYTATLLPNGTVLAAAGYAGFAGIRNSAELYDPGTTLPKRVTGRGSIDGLGGEADFTDKATQSSDRASGSIAYSDLAAGISIAKAKVRTLTFTGARADLSGVARLDDGTKVTFNIRAQDKSSDGSTDTFSISLSNGYSAGGTLASGDIRIQ